jgi:hypothetical protein
MDHHLRRCRRRHRSARFGNASRSRGKQREFSVANSSRRSALPTAPDFTISD